ncbi:MAG: type II toxin-antitoxin system RelE/ParE family toxin [Candidatus Daviesbacteria bacterium]|nr:type II toxin-antitoxin system RelE/ParE family toxin [Candidatus Daviesbacteria bacterium]
MYRLIISPRAQKHFKDIKKENQEAVRMAIEDIKEDPLIGKPLSRELTEKFSYRIGVYRILYKVNQQDKIVTILSARHRGIAYN